MKRLFDGLTVRHPSVDDAQATVDLMCACDIAEYGEPDSSLDDLVHEWTLVDLDQDAWLVFAPDDKLVGYAIVFSDDGDSMFDFYAHPAHCGDSLRADLVAQCRAHARAQTGSQTTDSTASTIISQVNEAGREALEKAGFAPRKFYFRMQAELDTLPVAAVWPEGCALRTMVPEQDDQIVYDLIQTAFECPGRKPPSLKSWRDSMMRPDHFESDLWFLLFDQEQLIGAALCYDYPDYGWVRQLGVAPSWRRKGVGTGLLLHAFLTFFEREHSKVALGVDSERPQAQSLYENAGMKCVRRFDEYHRVLGVKAD